MFHQKLLQKFASAATAALMLTTPLTSVNGLLQNPVTAFAAKTTSETTRPIQETPEISHKQNIKPGNYQLINSGNHYAMTHQTKEELSKHHPVGLELNEQNAEQVFKLQYVDDGMYRLSPGDDQTLYLNCTCKTANDVKAGTKMSAWPEYTDGTQYFWISLVNDTYVIECSAAPGLVVAPTSKLPGAGLELQPYTGSELQLWDLQPFTKTVTVTTGTTTQKVTTTTTSKTAAATTTTTKKTAAVTTTTTKKTAAATTTTTKKTTPTATTTTGTVIVEHASKQNITPGDYSFLNAKNGYAMTHQTQFTLSQAHPIGLELNTGELTQRVTLTHVGSGKYSLAIGDHHNLFVNCTCKTAGDIKAGVEMSGWKEYTDGTQYFWITEVGSNQYILQNAVHPELVIAPASDQLESGLQLQLYTGSVLQKWKLVKLPDLTTTTSAVKSNTTTTTTTTTKTTTTKTTTTTTKTTTTTTTTTTAGTTTSTAESTNPPTSSTEPTTSATMTTASSEPTTETVTTTQQTTTTTVSATTETVTSATAETTITVTETTSEPLLYLLGDLDGKNGIGAEDAQLCLLAYVNIMADMSSGLAPEQLRAADVNGDGQLSVDDAQLILLYYVNNTLSRNNVTWSELLGS